MADTESQPTATVAQANANVTAGGNNKTISISIASSVCVILAWVVKEKFKIDIPPDVQAAAQGLIGICAVWFIPHSNSSGAAN